MKIIIGLVGLGVLVLQLSASAQTPQSPPPLPAPEAAPVASPTPTAYATLVDRLKAGDRTVNFTEARTAFTETPAYSGMMMVFYQSLWGALNARDFEGAVKIADTVLQRNYVEPNAHMVAAIAHNQLGHREDSLYHRFVADGLLQSITSLGDGQTATTAYRVIDVSEEYALFRAMNLTARSQSAGPPNGGPIVDRMTLVDTRTNEEQVMFFSVANPESLKRMTLGGQLK